MSTILRDRYLYRHCMGEGEEIVTVCGQIRQSTAGPCLLCGLIIANTDGLS
ncbi:hypothetical protein PISMIDRAFT_681747, partial [Pisolithus microcarpus 441]